MAVVAVGYFSIDSAGGSGYLGAFLAGLIVGNMDQLRLGMHTDHERDMRVLVATITDVVVILVFITLGANLPGARSGTTSAPRSSWSSVCSSSRGRSPSSSACPDRRGRWTRQEIVFLAWTRETGVVAAALAGLMVGLDVQTRS